MALSTIEKNKLENRDIEQIDEFSDFPISNKDIIIIESNNSIVIAIRKFLMDLGFENIHVCKGVKEGLEMFIHFIGKDVSVPIIIDNEVNKNIKKTIKEVLEIQPSAKIIVMTAKKNTDSEILDLINLGISSIVHKPLIFDDVKKSLSDILEKNDNIEETEMRKNFESSLHASNKISQNKIKDILKVDQSEIETMMKNAINNRKIIVDKEILEAACNQCNSTNITYTSECPHCNGINFKQKGLIHHYSCGEVYPKETDYRTCPKCNKQIGSAGTDYKESLDYFVCSSCNDRFPKPQFKFTCLDCGNIFIDVLASWKKGKLYKNQK